MIGLVRAATLCAALALGLVSAQAADKAFRRDDLADSAIKLEAQIKSEAGPVAKTTATLKTDADAAFKRSDFRSGLQILGQIAAVSPEDSGNWLRLARVIFQIVPKDSSEQTFLLERASTAAYIAYQRAGNAGEEADALAVLGRSMSERRLWRPALDALRLSLDMREVADVRGQYEKLRDEHGFRLLDYTVDSDSASPRACFQFSEELAKRTDFAPYLALAGNDKPALTSEGKQLCVDGLTHGERYNINLRAGLPSSVKEGLPKSAEFNIYVRDRKPFVRFTGRAYVLPRTGQRGIPVVSVNTPAVKVDVFRIGDRNLINTVIDSDFQRALSRYELSSLGDERGVKVWSGELATATTLNQDVTTAFPVDQALGDLQPGVYVMTAAPKTPGSDDDSSLATQWFIVSDLGVTAFSGNDGIHVFVNSLATTDAVAKAEVRLVARNNEILATRKTDDSGHVLFEAGLARGEGGLSPAMVTVSGEKTDYAFLSLKTTAFDLSDRGVEGREVPDGPDAFVYAERGVYRSNETVYLTALLRDGQGNAVTGGPLTLVIERPDGVEFRRAMLPDQGAGGRSMALTLNPAVPAGTWRVRAFTDPKGVAIGQTTFMVEDYIPERLEFDLSANDKLIKADAPVELKVDGHFLYGAPASGLQLEGDMLVAPASERPGFAGYQFGVADDQTTSNERTPIEGLPETDANGAATFPVSLAKPPSSTRPQEAQVFIRMAEAGGRAVERKLVLPVAPASAMIGVKPLFSGKSIAEGDKAGFDVVFVSPDGKPLARDGLRYELLKIESRYQWYRQSSSWEYEPVKSTSRVADGDLTVTAEQPGADHAVAAAGPLPARRQIGRRRRAAHIRAVRCRLVLRRQRRYARPSGNLDRQTAIPVRRHHGGLGQCALGGQADHQCGRRPAADDANHRRQARHRPGQNSRRQGLGHRRLCGGDIAPPARCGGPADAEPRHRAEMVRHRQADPHAAGELVAAGSHPSELDAEAAGQARRPQPRRGRQGRGRGRRCRHSQSDQLQAAGAGRLLSRPAPDDRGNPRPLWAIDRRHAGHARPAQDRWRCRRRGTAGQPADAKTAGALFRHRHRRRRRHRRDQFRHSRVRRHRARDGGGLDRDQTRPRHHGRHRARSRGADRNLAALPAQRRSRHDEL